MTDSSSDYSSSDNEDNFRDGGAKSHTYTSNYTSQMFVSAKNKETDLRKNEVRKVGPSNDTAKVITMMMHSIAL